MPQNTTPSKAALIIIGNEILSGRTQDKNINYIAKGLSQVGVRFAEVRVIPDIEEEIIAAIHALCAAYDYVFTTGGIGPTHDDITAASVAKAFDVALKMDEPSRKQMESYYGTTELNEARLKMARIPEGSNPIGNPVTGAPGFRIENLFVMAGIPSIMQAMFDSVKHELLGGIEIHSKEVVLATSEGVIAEELSRLQEAYSQVEIGSYPFIRDEKLAVSITMRTHDEKKLAALYEELHKAFSDKIVTRS